jgi:transposase
MKKAAASGTVLIVALARKLLIAFWKYVTAGVVLEGAATAAA